MLSRRSEHSDNRVPVRRSSTSDLRPIISEISDKAEVGLQVLELPDLSHTATFDVVKLTKKSLSGPHHRTIYFEIDENGVERVIGLVGELKANGGDVNAVREQQKRDEHTLILLLAGVYSHKYNIQRKMSLNNPLGLVSELPEIWRRERVSGRFMNQRRGDPNCGE